MKLFTNPESETFKKENLLLFFILISAFLLRIYKVFEFFNFNFEEEIIAFKARQLFLHGKFFLIGGVTPFHVHLGPLYHYFSAIFLLFPFFLHPVSWAIWAPIFSVFTIFLLYLTGKNFFNKRVGLIASFLASFSFLQNLYDRRFWPLTFGPLYSLLVMFSLFKLIKGEKKYFWLLIATLIFVFQTDPSFWGLFVVSFLVLLSFKPKIGLKKILAGVALFILSNLPLLFFDLRHEGSNISGIFQYFQERRELVGREAIIANFLQSLLFIPKVLARLLWVDNNEIARQLTICPQFINQRLAQIPWLFKFFSFMVLVFLMISFFRTKKAGLKIIASTFLVYSALILLYGGLFAGVLLEQYLVVLFPAFFLLTASFFDFLFRRNGGFYAYLLFFLFFIFNATKILSARNDFGLKYKIEAVEWVKKEIGPREFALDSLSSCFRYNGIRYLFALVNFEPKISFVDPQLFWLYDKEPGGEYPENLVVFMSKDFEKESEEEKIYQRYQAKTFKRQNFGGIEVLLVDNKNGEFSITY